MNFDQKQVYGIELILDLYGCNVRTFNRIAIEKCFIELCDLIEMERCDLHFWDDIGVSEEERQTNPMTIGTSAVQFILTSTIVIHTLEVLRSAYINVFSCKEFDSQAATEFLVRWFEASEWSAREIERELRLELGREV